MTLSFRLNKTADFIFDYLTDMQKFVSVHPVISKIDQTHNNCYLIHETIRLGFVPFLFTYPVVIIKNDIEKVVKMRATVMRLTEIEMEFVLKTQGDFTVVEEKIHFKSILPVKTIMKSIFRKQHTQLFKNIDLKTVY